MESDRDKSNQAQITIRRAIRDFLRDVQASRGWSIYTLRNYSHALDVFLAWANELKLKYLKSLGRDDIVEFQLHLQKRQQPISQKTINYYLIALRSLLKYWTNEDLDVLAPEKVRLAKTSQRQIHFLESDELEKLLEAIPTNSLSGIRDRAIVAVLIATGLRVSELTQLKRSQVSLKTGEFSIRGKGGKVRPVFLTDVAKTALGDYITTRQDTNPFIFIRHYQNPKLDNKIKRPLSDRAIQRLVRSLAARAGIVKPISPHKLRHSFATDLLRNGADLRSVQELLGHASVNTTQVYTHVTNQALKATHQRVHSHNRPKDDQPLDQDSQT